ncbi:MAG: transposase zinc-binding domain-containing protein [Armatimonadetes bacterium]|nr:transposase zinc-binding domain-containing protein [Armatimonadota bacterium]
MSCYESRFEATHGPLRPEVEKALFAFSQCGDPNLGVTLFRCFECNVVLAVPFSCQSRICPCCIARKATVRDECQTRRKPRYGEEARSGGPAGHPAAKAEPR